MEEAKQELGIEEYSFSQSTLEQVGGYGAKMGNFCPVVCCFFIVLRGHSHRPFKY